MEPVTLNPDSIQRSNDMANDLQTWSKKISGDLQKIDKSGFDRVDPAASADAGAPSAFMVNLNEQVKSVGNAEARLTSMVAEKNNKMKDMLAADRQEGRTQYVGVGKRRDGEEISAPHKDEKVAGVGAKRR
jgi:hypothetical protein